MALSPAETAHRLELYNRGLTDRELAEAVGISYNSAYDWRRNRNLPRHAAELRHYDDYKHHVPMEEALSPDQCGRMRAFLGGLIFLANKHTGKQVDVSSYMKNYRNNGMWGKRKTGVSC